MLIGISGKMQVGKTTLANIAVRDFGFIKHSFADALKQELMELLASHGISYDPSGFSINKNEEIIFAHHELPDLFRTESFNRICKFDPIHHMYVTNYRYLMQWYGNAKRELNRDYWVQALIERIDQSKNIIVDDVRHINEAVYLQVLGALLIRVNRPVVSPKGKHHISECALDNFPGFDVVINKSENLTLTAYESMCRDHLALWTGALDDEPQTGATASTIPYRE